MVGHPMCSNRGKKSSGENTQPGGGASADCLGDGCFVHLLLPVCQDVFFFFFFFFSSDRSGGGQWAGTGGWVGIEWRTCRMMGLNAGLMSKGQSANNH